VDESERLQAADLAADRGVVAPDLIGEGADREVALHRDADEQREQRGVQRDAGPGQDQVVALGPVEDVVGTPRLVSRRGADFWIRLKASVSATLPKWRQRGSNESGPCADAIRARGQAAATQVGIGRSALPEGAIRGWRGLRMAPDLLSPRESGGSQRGAAGESLRADHRQQREPVGVL
jgi:hypothetical protein